LYGAAPNWIAFDQDDEALINIKGTFET